MIAMDGRPMVDLTDADSLFLFGDAVGELPTNKAALPRALRRVLIDSGAGEELALAGVNVTNLPDDQLTLRITPDAGRLAGGLITIPVDIVAQLSSMFAGAKVDDRKFEQANGRWERCPDRTSGYVPSDAGSVRWTMLYSGLMGVYPYDDVGQAQATGHVVDAIGAAYAYLGVPHFIPAARALDVATAVPPPAAVRGDIRLPSRYVMVFHDGIPLSVVAGDDAAIEDYATGNAIVTGNVLLLGGLLGADEDGAVDPSIGFLIVAKKAGQGYSWRPVPIPFGRTGRDFPAASVLWNYAALLSWEGWRAPPRLPKQPGKGRARAQYRAVARSREAQQGGYHGVRVLNYTQPTASDLGEPEQADGVETAPRRELKYQHPVRAHWRLRVRVGIRRPDGTIGAVRGAEAVEGETFERVRRFIPRSVARGDLPLREDAATVYRLPDTIERVR